jgi:protein-L-isoaspartate(D-aspartate) O-methyltransferase
VDAQRRAAIEAMVRDDLERRGITDERVIEAMRSVPRDAFVRPDYLDEAFDDRPLPIGDGQTISQPYIVALMAEALRIEPLDRVLDVGTGSGYAAAVMARLAADVWSIERHRSLADVAAARLRNIGVENVHVVVGDGTQGWPDAAPYDAISVAAATSRVPQPLLDQLVDGGRLVIPIGSSIRAQELIVYQRRGERFDERDLGPVRFVRLVAE